MSTSTPSTSPGGKKKPTDKKRIAIIAGGGVALLLLLVVMMERGSSSTTSTTAAGTPADTSDLTAPPDYGGSDSSGTDASYQQGFEDALTFLGGAASTSSGNGAGTTTSTGTTSLPAGYTAPGSTVDGVPVVLPSGSLYGDSVASAPQTTATVAAPVYSAPAADLGGAAATPAGNAAATPAGNAAPRLSAISAALSSLGGKALAFGSSRPSQTSSAYSVVGTGGGNWIEVPQTLAPKGYYIYGSISGSNPTGSAKGLGNGLWAVRDGG